MIAPLVLAQYLGGTWSCTYRAGGAPFAYTATYTYDRSADTVREAASWAGGGDEELIAYNAQHGWTAVVLDGQGGATVMHGTGRDPNHIAYRSVYPDAGIAETYDRVTANEYTLHATARAAGKTITSEDTCLRNAH